jgi:hypothetical protein
MSGLTLGITYPPESLLKMRAVVSRVVCVPLLDGAGLACVGAVFARCFCNYSTRRRDRIFSATVFNSSRSGFRE